jgi:hypothetical protein
MKPSISARVCSLSIVSLMSLNGCDRQDLPSKTLKEIPQCPETAVGEMARSAIDKAMGVEPT